MAIFTNQASLRYDNVTVNSNVATGELLEAVSVSKTAVTPFYTAGSDVTYAISIINTGATALTGITVTDDLGAYPMGTETLFPLRFRDGSIRLFVGGVLQEEPTVTDANPLTVTGINVPAGGNALLLYEAIATEFAPLDLDGSVVNTVSVSGTGIGTPVEASATITPVNAANLTITKTITPSTVTENSRVTYTFTIQNFGNTEAGALANATVTDTFLPILTDLAVSLNGAGLTEGTDYTYDESTGLFVTSPGLITVPAASFSQNPDSGAWETTPGVTVLTVVGTI